MPFAPTRTLLATLFLSAASFAYAQAPATGAVSGTVFDPASRVLSHAEVKAINISTHVERSVATTSEGFYRVSLLPPGHYDLTVTQPGFAPNTAHNVIVTVSQTTSLDVTLGIAGAKETVQVEDKVSVAELESSTLGALIDGDAIRSVPLMTRNYTQVLGLSPGVIVDVPSASALGNGTQNVASNGATPTSNNIQFNGIDANNLVENSAAGAQSFQVGVAVPSPDAIQEFRVQTANFDAAYGRGTGANVDLVTRSGSPNFHGSVWAFVRNNKFNSNDFFTKQHLQPRPELKQNQFGASIGGPIFKNKTFFFGQYQGTYQANGYGGSRSATLPLLTNDRSAASLGAQFCPAGHLNSLGQPSNGYLTSAGGIQVACDGSNINPVALKILNTKFANGQFVVPAPQVVIPNSSSDPLDQLPQGSSVFTPPTYYQEHQFLVDLDHNFSARDALAGRFFYSRYVMNTPFAPNGANVPGWGNDSFGRNTMFVLSDTHVVSSSLLNVARFGFIRFDGNSQVENPLTAAAIGQATPNVNAAPNAHSPALSVGGFQLGDGGTPSQWQVTNSFHYQDTLAYTRGRHNARFGVEVKRHEVDEEQPQQADGNIFINSFADFLIGQSASTNGSPTGQSNISGTVAGAGIFRRDDRYTNFAAFAQDDIKFTQHLTVNAGLRYEIFTAPTETNGRLPNFDPSLATKGLLSPAGTFSGFTVPSNFNGPTVPSGVVTTPYATFYKTPHLDFGPRIGFVWQMNNNQRLVLRGGYGMYYDEHSGNVPEQTISQLPFSVLQFPFGAQAAGASLANPFQPPLPPTFPAFQARTQDTSAFIEATNPDIKDGRTDEYNLNIQTVLGKGYLFEFGYVGTRSIHRPGQVEFDQALLASPSHPVNGETTNTANNSQARLPWQGIGAGSLLTDSVFEGNYNSLQATLTHRMSRGFQMQASYTWSKNLDEVNGEGGLDVFELQLPTNNNLDIRNSAYGPANADRSQRFVVNFLYQAPKLASAPFLVRQVFGHWEFSGIGVIQAGSAFSIFDGNAGNVYGLLGGEERAQRAPGNPGFYKGGSLFQRVNGTGRFLNGAAFTRAPEIAFGSGPQDQDFGNSGVGIARGPGQHSMDFAIERVFPIHGENNFRFRAEAFNLTNTPQFANPNATIGFGDPSSPTPTFSSDFGRISAEQGGPHPRVIQFAAKYQF